MKTSLRALSFILIFSIFAVSCGTKERLSSLEQHLSGVYDYAKVEADFCVNPPSASKQKVKYLFILDHSGSNDFSFSADPDAAFETDPDGSRRYGSLISFIKNLQKNSATENYFNLINFADDATQPGGLTLEFTNNYPAFLQILRTDWIGAGGTGAPPPDPYDGGFTDYIKAIEYAAKAIEADVNLEALDPLVAVSYQVIFVTDGIPRIKNGTIQQPKDILPTIDTLLSKAKLASNVSSIVFNTSYYFNQNTPTQTIVDAKQLLEQMAKQGNGLFSEIGTGSPIDYQRFVPPSSKIQHKLVDVFVENRNGIWWDNGEFMVDSDGDGLPDLIESQLGSNPNASDSDNNDISDLVEYRLVGKPCGDSLCSEAGQNPYKLCAGMKDIATNLYSRSASDGLNDCEKYLLGASPESFNTNGDLIPDLLALKNGLPIRSDMASEAFTDPFADGLSNYSKLKSGLPIQISRRSISDFQLRTIDLVSGGSDRADTPCYHLTVSQVALSSYNNTIKIYLVQNKSTVQDKPFLVSAEKTLNNSSTITFVESDFK